jgi:hypothetical protein
MEQATTRNTTDDELRDEILDEYEEAVTSEVAEIERGLRRIVKHATSQQLRLAGVFALRHRCRFERGRCGRALRTPLPRVRSRARERRHRRTARTVGSRGDPSEPDPADIGPRRSGAAA